VDRVDGEASEIQIKTTRNAKGDIFESSE